MDIGALRFKFIFLCDCRQYKFFSFMTHFPFCLSPVADEKCIPRV